VKVKGSATTTGAGVPFGARRPAQIEALKPGRDGQKNACLLACGHIDGVITHTKTSNQLQAGLVGP
jgi:hypothetical protein